MLPVFEEGGFSSGSSRGRAENLCGDAQERAATEPRRAKLTEAITVKFSHASALKLDAVAARTGLTRAQIVRGLVRRYLESPVEAVRG